MPLNGLAGRSLSHRDDHPLDPINGARPAPKRSGDPHPWGIIATDLDDARKLS
jgi:hypothetical protein